jgi:hypothetical protein
LSIPDLQALFANFLFSRYLLSKTADMVCDSNNPYDALCRAEEIELWLQENGADVTTFLILDDYDQGMSELFAHNFVQCKNGALGLNEFNKASLILNTPLSDKTSTLPINRLALNIYSNSKCVEKESEKSIRVTSGTRRNHLCSFFTTTHGFNNKVIGIITDYDFHNEKKI